MEIREKVGEQMSAGQEGEKDEERMEKGADSKRINFGGERAASKKFEIGMR